jgi:hypothetical protein
MMINTEAWQEAQAAAEAQQPVVEEQQAAPQQATDDAPATPSEVHDEPGIPQQQGIVEDVPQAASQEQQQGLAEGGEYDPSSPDGVPVDLVEETPAIDDYGNGAEEISPTVSEDDDWDSTTGDWTLTDIEDWHSGLEDRLDDDPWDHRDQSDMPEDRYDWDEYDWDAWSWESNPSDTEVVSEGPTPGGYDGSGIAGGLGIDYDDADFGEETDERSPDLVGEKDASEAESEFTDADYQEVLDDLDNGNLDEVREFLADLTHGDDDEEAQDAPGDPDNSKLVDEGISLGDIVGEENVEEGLHDGNNTEEYTYDEDALEDLQDALQDGDEEDRAEALEELQGYLGGFDKGAEDEESDLHNHGDPKEVPNAVNEEAVDAPDASGAAVSGAAVGAEAAVGAGAVDEAIDAATEQADGAIDDALGIEGSGKVLDNIANGNFDEALDGATEWAGGAIDDALGIEGAGQVFDNLSEGDWGGVAEGALEAGLGYFGVEGADEILDGLSEGDWGAVAGGALDAGLDYLGIDTGGEVVEDLVNGDWNELADDAVDLGLDAALGIFGVPNGHEIVDAVAGGVVDEVVEEVDEFVEDVGDFFDSLW